MNRKYRLLHTAAWIALCSSPIVVHASDDEMVVRIGTPSWDAGAIIARDIGNLLSEHSDVKIEFVDIEGDIVWQELEDKDGQIDIFSDIWALNQQSFWDKFVEERGTVLGNDTPYWGEQGFYAFVPGDNNIEMLDIENLDESEIVELFDTDNNGKAEYWPGAEGWHSKLYSQVKMKDYGLGAFWEEIDATNEEFVVLLAERERSSEAIMFYYWKPDALHAQFPLVGISEQEFTEGCNVFVEPKDDEDWLSKSTFKCAYAASPIHIIFSADLFPEDSDLLQLLRDFEVDPEKLQQAMLQYKNKEMSLEESAQLLN